MKYTKYALNAIQRVMRRTLVGSIDDCWPCSYGGSYPALCYKRKMMLASRVVMRAYNGSFPSHLHVCHTCDNPRCVNINHLFLGTDKDNMEDCRAKGRATHQKSDRSFYYRGEDFPQSKLTEDAVRAIRMFRAKGYDLNSLASAFGVKFSVISGVVHRAWKHVSGAPIGDWSHIEPLLIRSNRVK